jgi:hypothetical protein
VSAGEDRCASCGARRFGAPWCGQCGRKREGAVAVAARPVPAAPTVRESRWAGSATTFSGPTKLLLTVPLVVFPAIPAMLGLTGGMGLDPLLLAGDGTGWFFAALILRSLWRKGRTVA